jgi:hypothetical protein
MNQQLTYIDKAGNEWLASQMYACDKCEDLLSPNDEAFEVRYGFICTRCAGH